MSAGICIMNRNAIAMAADSAVTVGDHAAIHNSANKLFSLSKVAPVGAIIYANSTFMGVPVEIIVKEYKKQIEHKTFPTLKDYLTDFIAYIEANERLFRFDINEENFVMRLFVNFIGGLQGDHELLTERKQNEIERALTEEEKKAIVAETIEVTKQFVDGVKKIDEADFSTYVRSKYKPKFIDFLKREADFTWLEEEQMIEIADKACDLYDSTFERSGYVGLAIAGYGDEEIYPSLEHIHLTGFVNGKTRYHVDSEISVNETSPASVVPLAQVDVMQTFLFGINDHLLEYLANEIPNQIVERFEKMDDDLFADDNKNEVLQLVAGITGNIISNIKDTAIKNYMAPVFESVSTLPIEELSLLAESMINITSIRRKVALDSNIGTVGGPIDVAIISKGDGFIWIKRKHYFDRDHNPQFFYSHYEGLLKESECTDE